jgi:hypothetical protein
MDRPVPKPHNDRNDASIPLGVRLERIENRIEEMFDRITEAVETKADQTIAEKISDRVSMIEQVGSREAQECTKRVLEIERRVSTIEMGGTNKAQEAMQLASRVSEKVGILEAARTAQDKVDQFRRWVIYMAVITFGAIAGMLVGVFHK